MLNRGIIKPCQNSWVGPVVLVTKKESSTRFCVDYRKVNEVTSKDQLVNIVVPIHELTSELICTYFLIKGRRDL